ncbi:MAG: hypothetical protein LBS68_03200 [Puniceicoccales bacterium]|jgi:hypothetical protein|nr:hypothetical protein [Puniceicoccales bacterium]
MKSCASPLTPIKVIVPAPSFEVPGLFLILGSVVTVTGTISVAVALLIFNITMAVILSGCITAVGVGLLFRALHVFLRQRRELSKSLQWEDNPDPVPSASLEKGGKVLSASNSSEIPEPVSQEESGVEPEKGLPGEEMAEKVVERKKSMRAWSENIRRLKQTNEENVQSNPQMVENLEAYAGNMFELRCQVLRKEAKEKGIADEKIDGELAQCHEELSGEKEFLETNKEGFTIRMRFCCLEDFMVCKFYEARRRLGLEVPIYEGKKYDTFIFQGGGAKGVAYVPLVSMFSKDGFSDLLETDCRASGNSIGAFAAACHAFHVENMHNCINKFQSAMQENNETDETLKTAYPSLTDAMDQASSLIKIIIPDGYPFNMDGLPIVKVMDEMLSKSVCKFLDTFSEDALPNSFTESDRERIKKLKQPFDASASREDYMLKFSDIPLLRKLPKGEENFHDLSMSIWDNTDHKKRYLRADTTPDLPIAYALRFSSSIPLAFKKISWGVGAEMSSPPAENGPKTSIEMAQSVSTSSVNRHDIYDGFIGTNSPVKGFGNEEIGNPILFLFDRDGYTYRRIFTPAELEPTEFRWRFFGIFGADYMRKAVRTEEKEAKRLTEIVPANSGSYFLVPNGNIKTESFACSEFQQNAVIHATEMAFRAWAVRRRYESNELEVP